MTTHVRRHWIDLFLFKIENDIGYVMGRFGDKVFAKVCRDEMVGVTTVRKYYIRRGPQHSKGETGVVRHYRNNNNRWIES